MNILQFLGDLLCPKFCVHCGKWGNFVCEACGDDIMLGSNQKIILPRAQYLDSIVAATVYTGVIKNLIKQFKYRRVAPLAQWGAHYIWQFTRLPRADFITFVPIHRRRYHERGFNQSRLLAQAVAKRAALPCRALLRRDLYREKQALSKDDAERFHKVRGVFSLSNQVKSNELQGKNIIIIDDVITTGATLNECARRLKKAGARQVHAVCLAHGQ